MRVSESCTVTEAVTGARLSLSAIFGRNGRPDLDRCGNISEAGLMDLDPIQTEGKSPGDEHAGVVGDQRVVVLVGLTHQFDGGF